ncbi:unnamed protein product [Soboliphyme baturini]|uniref:Zinc transporter 2 n=1 Tax=Soboliphyme baturini TaxID=241478 RepID=A0A183J287_9BILA|nr:unnamed protein product [Soboliphyme baturini]
MRLVLSFLMWLCGSVKRRPPSGCPLDFTVQVFLFVEILGAVLSILIIWILTGVLLYAASERIINNNYEIEAVPMLITAGCGIIFNIIMGFILHGKGQGHSHGHRQDCSAFQILQENGDLSSTSTTGDDSSSVSGCVRPKKHKSINLRAAFIHVLGDFVQSIGVFIAALIIMFQPSFKLADPLCTFLFSALVLVTTFTVLRDAVIVLMEATPLDVSYDIIKQELFSIAGVKSVHSLHLWSLTLDKTALAVHLAIGNPCLFDQYFNFEW